MISVLKADGRVEQFSREKVLRSIKRAGIPEEVQSQVLKHVESKLYDNISSSEIFHHVTEFLRHSTNPYTSAKYSLKQAISMLGPTGYPFEDFIAEIFKAEGYTTETRTLLPGKCITHEIDVIAKNHSEKIMVEAKFHNQPGLKTDTHVALYTNARFEDLKDEHGFTKPWLVTNTKVTSDVARYSLCAGMTVLSWEYPAHQNIRDLIEKYMLYPVTALSSLSANQKQTLLLSHVVLCKDIAANHAKLDLLFLRPEEKEKVLKELSFVVKSNSV